MSRKFIRKYRFLPEVPRKLGSMDALLMPGHKKSGDSGFLMEGNDLELMAELDQADVDELFDLIEELESKNEKDN